MKDLTSPAWIKAKGLLFLFLGLLSVTLLFLERPTLQVAVLLIVAVWSFCRFYYFAFYVLERYVDPAYRFSGLFSLARHLLRNPGGNPSTNRVADLRTSVMDLNSIVAEWYLGLYPPEKMPMLAVWALGQDFDGPALRELAGRTSATRSHDGDLIERALRELGKEPIDSSSAGRLLAILLCQQIVSGKTSPHEGAARIWLIYDYCGRPKSLIPFVGFASEWEDDLDHRDHYDKLITEAARKFLDAPSF
jgi:hypothetical protein